MIKIVLVDTTHPGNIGAAARAMKTMGLERLALVSPQRFPSAECTARAAGADDLLARAEVFSSLEDAVADCALVFGASARTRSIAWPEVTPATAAAQILDHVGNGGGAAILFGRESSGLSNEQLQVCHAMIRIPTNADFASLNIAAAVQIICYEINKQRLARTAAAKHGLAGVPVAAGLRSAAPDTDVNSPIGDDDTAPPVTTQDMEYLYQHLEQTLARVGYLNRKKPRHLMRRLRRLFNRARLDSNEYNILRGILTAIGNRAGQAQNDE